MQFAMAAEMIAICVTFPLVLLVSGGLSCLIFMGMRDVRRYGIADGLPNFCGFLFLWTIIESACLLVMSWMTQGEASHESMRQNIALAAGILCTVSAIGGLGWPAVRTLLRHSMDRMMAEQCCEIE